MKRQQWLRAAALGISLSLLAASCGDDDGDDGGTDDGSEEGAESAAAEAGLECFEEAGEPGEPAPTDGFDGETINIGSISALSGDVAIIGNPLTAGHQAYFDYINEQGGIAGQYPVEFMSEDHEYNPSVAGDAYPGMVDQVVMFSQILGTPIIDNLLPFLREDCVLAAPATLDSKWVPEPTLLPIGAPYQMQAINGIDYYYNELGSEDDVLCALASDDQYGDAGLEGVQFAVDNLGLEMPDPTRFPAPAAERAEQTFETEVSELQANNCDVIFFVATAIDTSAFADALAETSGYDPTVIGQSPAWLGLFSTNEYLQEHFYFMVEGGEWGDTSLGGMELLMDLQENYNPGDIPPDVYFNFGVFQAMATQQVLEKAVELGDLSRNGIINAMAEVGTLTFGGDVYADYPYGMPEDREPPIRNTIGQPSAEAGGENGTGLAVVEVNYEADFATDFEIEASEE